MRNTWDDIAMPILRTVQEMEVEASSTGKGGSGATIGQMVERLGKDTNDVGPQLNSLESDGYVSVRATNRPVGVPTATPASNSCRREGERLGSGLPIRWRR